jgi:hypothetical protein
MSIKICSTRSQFQEYIKRLIPSDDVFVLTDENYKKLTENPNEIIILDAHSENPYSEYSALCLLDRFWRESIVNPVIILGWQPEDDVKNEIKICYRRYFGALYKDSYKYLQLPEPKSASNDSLQETIQNIKPLNRKYHE